VGGMNNGEIIGKVHNSMYQQIKATGMAVPVQVLMDLGYLSAADYENWRFGRLDYLERVCKVNLRKLSFIMKEVRAYARKNDLKPSWTFYKQWGRKGKRPAVKLRFSKSGDEDVERGYATHYVSAARMAELKGVHESAGGSG
jgi:hypothetical protein